jgi:hypothetical protein
MPTRYNSVPVAEDAPRLALPVLRVNPVDPHNRFLRSKEYGDLVAYLKGGILELQNRNLGRNQIKNTKRKAEYYTLTDRGLLKRERNGFMSKCILRDEVPKVLKDLHDGCGHFATAITLDRTVGNFFWPTRTRDIEQYCLSCKTCQRMGYKRQSTELIPIQRFEPLAMIGLDFLGPINPECEVTQTKYVLIAVDYFSRFVWARPYPKASGDYVIAFFEDFFAPVFGYPKAIYSDNGSHFIGNPAKDYFKWRGIHHSDAPVAYPSSVGLVERSVQLVRSRLTAHAIERGPIGKKQWGLAIPQAMLSINSRLVKIHGFTPGEIMLGYQPRGIWQRQLENEERLDNMTEAEIQREEEKAHLVYGLRMERRDEQREAANTTVARNQKKLEGRNNPVWTQPKEGDLVLLWDYVLEKDLGRKLDRRWSEPHRLVKINPGGVSAMVCKLYGDGSDLRRIHLNHLKVYCPRPSHLESVVAATTVTFSREAMRYAGHPGQRAIDLYSV